MQLDKKGNKKTLKNTKKGNPMDQEILKIEEACQFLQIGKRSLYKLAKEGKIPCKKILNKWRFDKEALKAWVGGRDAYI